MYHLWFLFSFWKLLIFLNKGSYLNGKYLFQMIAFKRTSSLPCFGLLNYFLCFIAGFFSSASGNLGNRGGGCRCWKALGVNFGHRCNWSGYWMPKGMEDFYADFKAIISYWQCVSGLSACLWGVKKGWSCCASPSLTSLLLTLLGSKPDWRDSRLEFDFYHRRSHAPNCLAATVIFTWRSWTTEVCLSLLGHRSRSPFSRFSSDLRTLDFQLCEESGALCLLPLPGRELQEQRGQGAIPGVLSARVNQAIVTCKALS